MPKLYLRHLNITVQIYLWDIQVMYSSYQFCSGKVAGSERCIARTLTLSHVTGLNAIQRILDTYQSFPHAITQQTLL